MKKLYRYLYGIASKEIDSTPSRLREIVLEPHAISLDEDLNEAAEQVKLNADRDLNYSGAELEGVAKSAVSFALNSQLSMDDLTKPVDEESIKVTMEDFLNALNEVRPAFRASTNDLERCSILPFRLRVGGLQSAGSVPKFLLPWFPPRVMMAKNMTIVIRMGTERRRRIILPLMRREMRKMRRTRIQTVHLRRLRSGIRHLGFPFHFACT